VVRWWWWWWIARSEALVRRFSIERELGPQRCGPVIFKFGFARSGFTPKSALPIIAALGGGP